MPLPASDARTRRTARRSLLLGTLCLLAFAGFFALARGSLLFGMGGSPAAKGAGRGPVIRQPTDAGRGPAAQASTRTDTSEKITRYIRERFNIPENVKLTVGAFRDSAFPEYYETTVTLDDGKQPRSQNFFVSKDGRYLIEGNIYTLGADPRREIVSAISLKDQPSQGPANAPVTIVEYADLECPMCARLHAMLEDNVLPKYADKVRVVFKEFPLSQIHEWAMTAALASQCVYQIAPDNFVAFRTLVFQNQATLNANNARDMLLHYGAQAGIDNAKLATCVDEKATLPRVEANLREGQALGVASTPTSFINGKVVVSAPEPAEFYKLLDEALQHPGAK